MANTVYENKILEAKAKDLLSTAVNARTLMTIDNSLVGSAGMIKTINTYTYSGTAEELAVGKGNTTESRGHIAQVGKDYTVKLIQQAFDYFDEDAMKDPQIVDMMLKGATQLMSNKMTSDFYTALDNGSVGSITFAKSGALSYDTIVDGIQTLNLEDESSIFIVIPLAWKASLRKDSDYKTAMQGQVVYNGQVGTICGIPVVATKVLTDKAFVMTKEAVTLFLKKDVSVEQARNADTRANSVYLRNCYICALTDATKACKITQATV